MEKMRNIGIWMPGSTKNAKHALAFWGYVFGWNGKARNHEERVERLDQVTALTTEICVVNWPNPKMYISGGYYKANKELCFRFYRALQNRVEKSGGRWRVVVHHHTGHKGFWW